MQMMTFDEYFGPARTMCTVSGIWPLEKDASLARRTLHWVAKFLTMLGNLDFIFPAMLKISEEREDFATVMRVSATMSVTLLLCVKQFYFTVRSTELGRVYSELKDLHVEVDAFPEGRNIYDGYARKCRRLTIIFFVSVMSNNLLGTFVSVVNSWFFGLEMTLPYELSYPFDTDESPAFEMVFAAQQFLGTMTATCYAGLDSLILSIVIHVCAQFMVLRKSYEKITAKEDRAGERNVASLKREIGRCVERHKRIISLAEEMESLFGPAVLGQYILNAVNLCLYGYLITGKTSSPVEAMRFGGFLISCLLQTAAFCLASEILISESTGVGDTVFHDVPWSNFPITMQRDLQTTMIRAQKSCCLTAAGFAVMNLELLPNILSAAFSYFTLLRQVKASQDE